MKILLNQSLMNKLAFELALVDFVEEFEVDLKTLAIPLAEPKY